MAKLHFKYGTMNSGKSIDLIRSAHNYEESERKTAEYEINKNAIVRGIDNTDVLLSSPCYSYSIFYVCCKSCSF